MSLLACSISLAMDAFAVSICKGISMRKIDLIKQCTIGIWFGTFQALMPFFGYTLSKQFKNLIADLS